MSIARFSVRNPVLVNLLTVLVIVAGLIVYLFLIRREVFPQADVGVVLVTSVWPGVAAEDVERDVTIPLEREISRIDGLDELISISAEGVSQIFVRLTPQTDTSKAVLDIQAEVNKARLPAEIDRPMVREMRLPFPVGTVGVYLDPEAVGQALARSQGHEIGEDGLPYALERRMNQVAQELEQAILHLPHVDSVNVVGMRERRIFVEGIPAQLRRHRLDLDEIAQAIRAANRSTPSGFLDTSAEEITLRTGRLFTSHPHGLSHAVNDVVVKTGPAGSAIGVENLATVIDGFEDLRIRTRVYVPHLGHRPDSPLEPAKGGHGLPAVLLVVFKTDHADAIRVSQRLQAFVAQWQEKLPEGVRTAVYDDRSVYIKDRIDVVESNGLIGLVIVMLVLFFFLNYRMAFMTALGIPVSLFGTMIVLYALGYSTNLLSMFGIIIALGMVVDEGIIICENAYRHMENGLAPLPAALRGTSEVLWPVIASVATTMAAFLPLLLWGGVTGQFMAVIPVAVIVALAWSLFEALYVLPSHVAEWSHNPTRPQTRLGRVFDWLFAWTDPARNGFQRWFDKFRSFYVYVLVRALRIRYVVIVIAGVAFVLTWMLALSAGTAFMDSKRIDQFIVNVQMPKGSNIAQTGEMLGRIERIIHDTLPPGSTAAVQTEIGRARDQARVTTTGKTIGQITVELIQPGDYRHLYHRQPPYDYRDKDKVETWMEHIRTRLSRLPVAEFQVFGQQGGPPQGQPVEVRLRGENYDELVAFAEQVKDELKTIRGLRDVDTDVDEPGPEFRIEVDSRRARELGLSENAIHAAVRGAFEGIIATTITDNTDEIDVVVRLDQAARKTRDDILDLEIVASGGRRVPLKEVVTSVTKTLGKPPIKRFDNRRGVVVSAEIDAAITAREANALARERIDRLLDGRADIAASYEGRFASEAEGFLNLGYFALLAAGLIYVILAAVLRSFAQPILIMTAVPLAFIGVTLGLFILGERITVISMVGAVALIGIVVNDSTVLVDFVNRQRREGESRWTALVRGSKLRLRPIILTTLTTIAGLFTITYAPYLGFEGDTFLAPMGVAISWGLTFATALTLLVVPCMYAIYEDFLRLVGYDPRRAMQSERELRELDRLERNGSGGLLAAPTTAPTTTAAALPVGTVPATAADGMALLPGPATATSASTPSHSTGEVLGVVGKPEVPQLPARRDGATASTALARRESTRRSSPDTDALDRARSQRRKSDQPPTPDNYKI